MARDITEAEFLDMLQCGQRHFHKICVEAGIFHGFDFSNITIDECIFSVVFSGDDRIKIYSTRGNYFYWSGGDGLMLTAPAKDLLLRKIII
jgi:hypothetical protein